MHGCIYSVVNALKMFISGKKYTYERHLKKEFKRDYLACYFTRGLRYSETKNTTEYVVQCVQMDARCLSKKKNTISVFKQIYIV